MMRFASLPRRAKVTMILVGVLSACPPALAETPKGEELMDKYVEVTGGMEAYKKLNNRMTQGTFEIVGTPLKGPVAAYEARPNLQYTWIQLGEFGNVEEGTDGIVAWSLSGAEGARLKEGAEKASAIRQAAFDVHENWRKYYPKVECTGEEVVNDTACWKVVLTPAEGSGETRYFSKSTGLLVKSDIQVATPVGEVLVEVFPEDYKAVNGVKLPYKVTVKVLGQVRLMQMERIEHNVDLPADRFAPPAAVRSLLDEAGSAKPTQRGDEP